MKEMIFCKPTGKGIHSFYLETSDRIYFLFSQDYRKGVQNYYSSGVRIDESFNYGKSHGDSAITRTMEKVPIYIRYIEKEYGIEILEKTRKKSSRSRNYRYETVRCA